MPPLDPRDREVVLVDYEPGFVVSLGGAEAASPLGVDSPIGDDPARAQPLATDELAGWVAPVLQHYLTGAHLTQEES